MANTADIRIETDSARINRELWDRFVHAHPRGNVFQTPRYHSLIKADDHYVPFVVAAIDNPSGALRGLVQGTIQREKGLSGYFSRRGVIWGGPLVSDDDGLVLAQLLRGLTGYLKRKVIYLEFRNLFDLKKHREAFRENGFEYREHYNYQVPLSDRERVRGNFSKNRLRQIRRSIEHGAIAREAGSLEEVRQFFLVLRGLYRGKIKKPLPQWSFFKNFYESATGVYLVVEHEKKIIGGIMCPIDHKKIYELYICGMDGDFPDIFPSVMATNAAIEYGLQKRLECFDFMGAGSPDKDYGVRKFKARFGGELVEHGRFIRVFDKSLFVLGKIGMAIFGSLKK